MVVSSIVLILSIACRVKIEIVMSLRYAPAARFGVFDLSRKQQTCNFGIVKGAIRICLGYIFSVFARLQPEETYWITKEVNRMVYTAGYNESG